jgi:hypothetical protein
MANEKFTPGPWSVVRMAGYAEVTFTYPQSETKLMLATAYGDNAGQDANLIAAAPDLYAALEKAAADYGKPGGPWNIPSEQGTWIDMAQKALTKARGES